ncbi:MAG: hypothetical protein M3072_16515, partial [Candidatus Dormibacteraeota bacterium]|nr:hypothetical protein [Candidatus Dormibacteraeota bacterium]
NAPASVNVLSNGNGDDASPTDSIPPNSAPPVTSPTTTTPPAQSTEQSLQPVFEIDPSAGSISLLSSGTNNDSSTPGLAFPHTGEPIPATAAGRALVALLVCFLLCLRCGYGRQPSVVTRD